MKNALSSGSSFYQKTASALMAAGALAGSADAAVIHMSGLDTNLTGDITPDGGDSVQLQITTQFASSAYGFVQGVGNLTFPTGALAGFFRASEFAVVSEETDDFVGALMPFGAGSYLLNHAQFGSDNYFTFSFTSNDVNGGNPVYGWARINIPSLNPYNATIQEWAYEDSGEEIQVGAVPEPSGLSLLALGAVGAMAFHRRRRPVKSKE